MTICELAALVRAMRSAQKSFFECRTQRDLDHVRQLEAAVDEALAQVAPTEQGDLFGIAPGPYRRRK